LVAAPRLFCSKPCVERFVFADCGGVKVFHACLPDCPDTLPRLELTAAEPALFRFPLNDDSDLAPLLAPTFARDAPLKNRCEAGGALRTADELALRPDGL
jgi:hypothetical protein